MIDSVSFERFAAAYAPDDIALAAKLLETARLAPEQERGIDRVATRLIEAVRAQDDRLGGVEDLLREFALSTTRLIGRRRRDSSPVRTVVKGWPARIPRSSRAVVPEFPQSTTSPGSLKPSAPTPWIR